MRILASFPILRAADLQRMFYLYTDASAYAIGAFLAQIDDELKEYVVENASYLLKDAQLRWSITDKELYTMVWAIDLFKHYLQGVHFKCIVDHKALIYLKSLKDLNNKYTI